MTALHLTHRSDLPLSNRSPHTAMLHLTCAAIEPFVLFGCLINDRLWRSLKGVERRLALQSTGRAQAGRQA